MRVEKNQILQGKHQKPILTDVLYTENNQPKPVVVFCHGYKGFKDWGAWDLMATTFAKADFFFVKFNFSYNGGTIEQPIDFPDLEAFGNNNYTKELDDLEIVIDWITTNKAFQNEVDATKMSIIGHSRGGGVVSIKAAEDDRITSIISLAGVCDFGKRTATIGNLEEWKKDGVKYVLNGRTKQQMPHFYQFYEDFKANENRLNIQRAVAGLKIPHLIIHGDGDTSVSIEEGKKLHKWNPKSDFAVIKDANHVFNTSHPWDTKELSVELKEAVEVCINFLKDNNE